MILDWKPEMLNQRIATGVVLAAAALAIIIYTPSWLFALITGFIVVFAGWEWSNFADLRKAGKVAFSVALAMMLGLIYTSLDIITYQALIPALATWVLLFVAIGIYPSGTRVWKRPWLISLLGYIVLAFAWLALLLLRELNAGTVYIISLLLIVFGADIGAYFTGKAWGKHTLAPSLSPGKTWEGVLGGVVTGIIVYFALLMLVGDALSVSALAGWFIFLIATTIILISIGGDLTESMLKRERGIKDSGRILPGHGGILDRIDSLLAALPFYAFLVLAVANNNHG